MLTLRVIGDNQQISYLHLTLFEGACEDSFTSSQWNVLEAMIPTKLQEDYFTCTKYWYDALIDALGIV